MEMLLNYLALENFKGLREFHVQLDGHSAVIAGENGTGKTTVYDGFLWLLFGKDSTGRKEFEVRPLDENNQPVDGLVVAVEARVNIDGGVHELRKEQRENYVRDNFKGYETICYIDQVPKKVSEYNQFIADIIAEDTFKLLTDLRHFNEKIHWTERRKVLLDMIGEFQRPEGFNDLLELLGGRSIEEYKKVLQDQKKRLVKERDEMSPRIDEIARGLKDGEQNEDRTAVEKKRDSLKSELSELEAKRKELLASEKDRQERIDQINKLKGDKIARESELKSDTAGCEALLEEKAKLQSDVADWKSKELAAKSDVDSQENKIATLENQLAAHQSSLNAVREEYKRAKANAPVLSDEPVKDTCYACGQKLPASKIEQMEKKRQDEFARACESHNKQLADIKARGDKLHQSIQECRKAIDKRKKELNELIVEHKQIGARLAAAEQTKDERIAEIDEAIKNRDTVKPEEDTRWKQLTAQIEKLESELGEPVSERIEKLESQRSAKQAELDSLNETLNSFDRMQRDKKRIDELEAKEKQLSQQIADTDGLLNRIDEYKQAESHTIEQAVNGMFAHVEFKLFNRLLNGSIEETCQATLDGVPYADMSCGQRIMVGIDIINVLSGHYGCGIPLFIDNAESMTLPIEAAAQTVQLRAVDGQSELKVENEKERAAVA